MGGDPYMSAAQYEIINEIYRPYISSTNGINKLIYSVWGSMGPTPLVVSFCLGPPSTISPPPALQRSPPFLVSAHKDVTELAWVIGIIIISEFSASWVPEKVREQHEDRLMSMLVRASIWQQTIGKGPGPGHSSMAQNSSHGQNTRTPRQHQTQWRSVPHRLAGWMAGCTAVGWQ